MLLLLPVTFFQKNLSTTESCVKSRSFPEKYAICALFIQNIGSVQQSTGVQKSKTLRNKATPKKALRNRKALVAAVNITEFPENFCMYSATHFQ